MRRIWVFMIAVGSAWLAHERTDGFSLRAIQSPFSGDAAVQDRAALPLAVSRALSQPYRYLGKGRQAFVFESADGKTVIKFFNQDYFQIPWYACGAWPFFQEKRQKILRQRAMRKEFYSHGYAIAFGEMPEETGVLHLHLAPSATPLPCLEAVDKASRLHRIDLNRVPFVLQTKMTPFYAGLEAVWEKEGNEGLYRIIDGFVATIARRLAKKIGDGDADIEHNWGLFEGRALHLDPGRFYRFDAPPTAQDQADAWRRATCKFRKWLVRRHPEAASYLDEKIAAVS